MAEKNSVDVLVGGKVIKLAGYESEEYLQTVAGYMDRKAGELKELDGYNHMSSELRNILLALNIADDYFKVRRQADEYDGDIGNKDEEIYALKQKIVQAEMDAEKTKKELGDAAAKVEKEHAIAKEAHEKAKDAEDRVSEAKRALKAAEQEAETLRKELERTRAEQTKLSEDLTQSRQQLEQTRKDLEKSFLDLEQAQADLAQSRKETEEARRSVQGTQQTLWQGGMPEDDSPYGY